MKRKRDGAKNLRSLFILRFIHGGRGMRVCPNLGASGLLSFLLRLVVKRTQENEGGWHKADKYSIFRLLTSLMPFPPLGGREAL